MRRVATIEIHGTGEYRGIRGRDLRAHDHNTLDGQNGVVSLEGAARY